jgi:hypothetical protein
MTLEVTRQEEELAMVIGQGDVVWWFVAFDFVRFQ